MSSSRIWKQYLQSLTRAGLSHLPPVQIPRPTVERRRTAAATAQRKPVTRPARAGGPLRSPVELQPESVRPPTMHEQTTQILSAVGSTPEEKEAALCQLATVVAGCSRCTELAETRTQTVFGVGNPDAQIMFIGEAPGADEDKQGEPFVGRAGQLLNKIIEACQLKREDIYICNILRCRPPGNRNPQPQEAANCREYLNGQIQVVQPDYIVCWGSVAAQNLLGEKRSIGRLRGSFHSYEQAKVLCTYHPSYLLRNPAAKKDVWEDMKILMKDQGVELA